MSLLYGLTGSTNLNEIAGRITQLENDTLLTLSLLMIMAGLCFKIAAVPFHMWVPDAYEGAPTPVTAFMSVAVKAAAFAILAVLPAVKSIFILTSLIFSTIISMIIALIKIGLKNAKKRAVME